VIGGEAVLTLVISLSQEVHTVEILDDGVSVVSIVNLNDEKIAHLEASRKGNGAVLYAEFNIQDEGWKKYGPYELGVGDRLETKDDGGFDMSVLLQGAYRVYSDWAERVN
jgi:hypothetical protein